VRPVVERAAGVTAGLALEADEQGVRRRDEVVLLHRLAERVAEGLDDPGVVWPVGVVQGQTLAAVTVVRLDRRLDAVHAEAGKVETRDLARTTAQQVRAAGVRWVPVRDRQEDTLVTAGEGLAVQQPVAAAVFHAGGFHVTRPVAHVEVEAGVEQGTSGR